MSTGIGAAASGFLGCLSGILFVRIESLVFLIAADRDNCSNIVLFVSGCFSMTEYRRVQSFAQKRTVTHFLVSAYAIHCVAIQNVHTAPTNAVFFPSAQMKNLRFMPNFPTETQAIPARTQSTQTIHRSGDKRPAPELHKLYPCKPAAAESTPPQRISPRENHACVIPW